MKPFEYLITFLIVLIGLAIGDVTISLHKLLAAGRRVKWHWAAPATAGLGALVVIAQFMQAWYGLGNGSVRFLDVLPITVRLVLLFLACAATLPDKVPEEGLDLKAFYLGNRLHFWGLITTYMAVQLGMNLLNFGAYRHEDFIFFVAEDVAVAVVALSLIKIRTLWWHGLCLAGFLALELYNWWGLRIG